MERLKELIETERRKNPKEFIDAEQRGELLHYLESALKSAKINPALLNQYCKERRSPNEILSQVDSFVDKASDLLDDTFYGPHYQSNLPADNLGIADVMAAFRSNSDIAVSLKWLKVGCALTSMLCVGLGLRYLVGRYVPNAIVFLVAGSDLFRISYNCYDKKYCSLYLRSIGGNVSKMTDTLFKFAKSVVGMSEPEDDPLLKLRTQVMWRNLLEDTIALQLYLKIADSMKKQR